MDSQGVCTPTAPSIGQTFDPCAPGSQLLRESLHGVCGLALRARTRGCETPATLWPGSVSFEVRPSGGLLHDHGCHHPGLVVARQGAAGLVRAVRLRREGLARIVWSESGPRSPCRDTCAKLCMCLHQSLTVRVAK